jgi:hypothetical protein
MGHDLSLDNVLACPCCGGSIVALRCTQCTSEFFALGEIPCLFPSGLQQKALWEHSLAYMAYQANNALAEIEQDSLRYDNLPLTIERLNLMKASITLTQKTLSGLMAAYDLGATYHDIFADHAVENYAVYYHHILRDWGWDQEPSRWFATHANAANLARVEAALPPEKPDSLLVLGAGAGRLSADLHELLAPQMTLASDINPLLLACSHQLVAKQAPFSLPELYNYPQKGYPLNRNWTLKPLPNPTKPGWFALGADVWNMPLKPQSMDMIVTSWLMDVNGGDVKDFIAVIAYLLKPGGTWINTGPLLYSRENSFSRKYSHDEIIEFAKMVGFSFYHESTDDTAHLASPMGVRMAYEQVWNFGARKLKNPVAATNTAQDPPAWLIMHHLPIPALNWVYPQDNAIAKAILEQVDGKRSLHALSLILQPHLQGDITAKDLLVTLFGDILQGRK